MFYFVLRVGRAQKTVNKNRKEVNKLSDAAVTALSSISKPTFEVEEIAWEWREVESTTKL